MHKVGMCLYGSDSYGLNGPASDKDYKVFLCPDFKDLYYYNKVKKTDLPFPYTDYEHFSVMDCRDFNKGVLKGNVNCLEYLFSTEKELEADMCAYFDLASRAFKSGYLEVCWDTFFASLEGMVKNSLDRYGVTRKSMSRAYYLYMLAYSLVLNDFKMDENSWRGNGWVKRAKEMRFNEEAWMPTQEELYTNLFEVKVRAQEKFDKMSSERRMELKQWSTRLSDEMYHLVENNLKFEFLMRR